LFIFITTFITSSNQRHWQHDRQNLVNKIYSSEAFQMLLAYVTVRQFTYQVS
jgi:hypothetical protein